MLRTAISCLFLLVACPVLSDTHSCPDERPHPRGGGACDSCPWEETLAEYQAGDLSVVRDSKVFNHQIRVSVVCDAGRPVDIDDVYEKVDLTERMFNRYFGKDVQEEEGDGMLLEVIVGICDYYGSVDDCNMYEVCREGGIGRGCSVSSGQSFSNAGGLADHVSFVPYLPEGKFWWAEGNRYGNLQHEFAHLLDYTYIRKDTQRGNDLNWWVEGMPQFVQWKILNDSLSWSRGNDRARMLEVFTHRWNTSDYYDGMRVIAYLNTFAPYLLDEMVGDMRNGIYQDAESHLKWFSLLGYVASRHEDSYANFMDTVGTTLGQRVEQKLEGYVEGDLITQRVRLGAEATLP